MTVATWLAAAGALTTGCAISGSDGSTDTTATTIVTTTGVDTADLPADQVVWQELTSGGSGPAAARAAEVPTVTIYADGRIFVVDPQATPHFDKPVPMLVGTVAPERLEGFLDDVRITGLLAGDVDYGEPSIAEFPTTTVTYHAIGTPKSIEVYALGIEQGDSAARDSLTDRQVQARQQLSAMLLSAGTMSTDLEPWTPQEVHATMFNPDGIATVDENYSAPWPGPGFDEFPAFEPGQTTSCLLLGGDDAVAVYEAATLNPGSTWTSGEDLRQIVVAPVLPGEEGCPPS